jgi:hypothetical protein
MRIDKNGPIDFVHDVGLSDIILLSYITALRLNPKLRFSHFRPFEWYVRRHFRPYADAAGIDLSAGRFDDTVNAYFSGLRQRCTSMTSDEKNDKQEVMKTIEECIDRYQRLPNRGYAKY